MAEIWPRLRKKFGGDARRRRKSSKSKNANPFASSGLAKFAALLEVAEEKNTSSLVERTGVSVSTARSLSRSAHEWTANTLVRTASRRSESKEGSKSPEIVLLQCAVRPSDAQTKSFECAESLSLEEPGFEAPFSNSESPEVEKSRTNFCGGSQKSVANSESSIVGRLDNDLRNLSEEWQSQGKNITKEDVNPMATLSVALQLKTGRCTKIRSLNRPGWRQTSNSAFIVLVALGAFISSRFGKVGNRLAAVLTFNAVIQIWSRGKVYTKFIFSSVALYFLSPLRLYLTICPKRMSLLPRKLKVIAETYCHQSTEEESRKLEIDVSHEGRSSSMKISGLPLESAPSYACAPLSLLLTIPESSAAVETLVSPAIESIPATRRLGASSPSRRLAKKFSSKFKKLRMRLRSSSSSSSISSFSVSESSLSSPHSGTHFTGSTKSGSPMSPSLHSSGASSLGREKSSENECAKKSRLSRMSSAETLEHCNDGKALVNPNETTSSHSSPAEETIDISRNVSWPGVGLLVTLLFLLVGRLPAILATSLFFLVVSNAHYDRAHPRRRGLETRALVAARKLHRSPPPRGRRNPSSPPRRF